RGARRRPTPRVPRVALGPPGRERRGRRAPERDRAPHRRRRRHGGAGRRAACDPAGTRQPVTTAKARSAGLVVATALLVRLAAVLLSARTTMDVLRYHKVADHILNVSLNPYTAPRLYPYPPLWVWFEAGAGWLERHGA